MEQQYEERKLQEADWIYDIRSEQIRRASIPLDPSEPKPLKPVSILARRRNRFHHFEYQVGFVEKDILDLQVGGGHSTTKTSI